MSEIIEYKGSVYSGTDCASIIDLMRRNGVEVDQILRLIITRGYGDDPEEIVSDVQYIRTSDDEYEPRG